ncbi:SET and MYND domain-containing protein 5-like [Seriola lalandi dorsalis]|uniref:SET and MYND domain-containing protein 5-like n=1 Tax=Seriola lalandi dorsalis TaxID=1841481 RepID=UPI000C6FA016|nr:SET and MYND domain-containing protein 5-like [Seriola lalandi dorsalis]
MVDETSEAVFVTKIKGEREISTVKGIVERQEPESPRSHCLLCRSRRTEARGTVERREPESPRFRRPLCPSWRRRRNRKVTHMDLESVPETEGKDKAHWQKLFSHFCSRTANEEEEIAHKLLGEQFRGQLALLHSLFKAALYDDHLSRWFVPEGFRSLFSLVGTNGQGIGTSSLSQWVHACDALELPAQQREQLDSFIDQLYKDIEKETGDFLNCEGSGLFLLQSSCNHSCIPNAEASFPDNNFLLHLSALSDINPGEEICISYLDCCQRDRSRHSRHKILRENYLFVCSCPKCVSQMDELDLTSEEEEEEEGEAEGETEGDEMEDEMTDV